MSLGLPECTCLCPPFFTPASWLPDPNLGGNQTKGKDRNTQRNVEKLECGFRDGNQGSQAGEATHSSGGQACWPSSCTGGCWCIPVLFLQAVIVLLHAGQGRGLVGLPQDEGPAPLLHLDLCLGGNPTPSLEGLQIPHLLPRCEAVWEWHGERDVPLPPRQAWVLPPTHLCPP